jgi:hypothetical protein
MVLAEFRQRITCEGWQGENSAGVGKSLSRVRSGSLIARIHFSPWSIIGAALHTIRFPRMMEFLLSIVDAKSFFGVMFRCKLRLVTGSCSDIFLQYSIYRIYGSSSVFSATCSLHLTEYY